METERERIIRMISEGTLRPEEAAPLLAALASGDRPMPETVSEGPQKTGDKQEANGETSKTVMREVQFQRPDGTSYSVSVPPNLISAVIKIAAVELREASKVAAQDAWAGFKTMTKNKVAETRTNLKTKMSGGKKEADSPAAPVDPAKERKSEARRQVVQMVQNGRISPEEAAKLLEQIG